VFVLSIADYSDYIQWYSDISYSDISNDISDILVGYYICNNFINIILTARLWIYIEGESGADTSIKQPLNLKNILQNNK